MATLAGRLCTIKTGLTPVAVTGEGLSDTASARLVYVVTDAAKRAIDPATAITVYDNGAPVTSTDYAVNYADGRVTFGSARTAGHTITADMKYVPLSAGLSARTVDMTLPQPQLADGTCIGHSAPVLVEVAKKCQVSLTLLNAPAEDLDTGAGTMLVATVLGADRVFLEVAVSTVQTVRGWFAPGPASHKHALDSLFESTLTFVGVVQVPVGRPSTDQTLFSLT